ncbi:hypothetical protein ACQCX2_13610 [Propionibacteriaceae bacterium Y1700]|uniref:hypothetical protein n=1 Tax=Microlunatus sp. Y1700 TaxID=3418487 RepID=UPI003DA79661
MARTGQGPPRYARGDQHYRQTCRPSCQKPESTDEYGIVALSAKDRSHRWETVVIPSVRRTGQRAEETFHVVAATSEVVVINFGGDTIHGTDWDTFDDPQVRTIGLDPRTGKEVWSIDDTLTQLVVGDRVLAKQRRDSGESVPLAFDLAGRELWRMPPATVGSWVTAAGDLGIVQTQAATQLINIDDGRTGPTLAVSGGSLGPPFVEVLITGSGETVAAWGSTLDSDYRLATQGPHDQYPLMAGEPFAGHIFVAGAGQGYAWVHSADGQDRVWAVDRTGATRSPEIPGFPRAVTEDLVIVDGLPDGFEVHRYR